MTDVGELIVEREEPWKEREVLEKLLVEDERDQKLVAEMMGVSSSTISYWKDKLNVGVERVREEQGGGDLCVRCEKRETPDNTRNTMCVLCLDYVRSQESDGEWNMSFPEEVIDVEN